MQKPIIDDRELIKSYILGNESAFEKLLNRHKDRVYSHILMIIKDRDMANDVFQDTFIKTINTLKAGKYNEEGKFLPWVLRIAHNLVIDHFRRNKKMNLVRGDEDYDVFATIKQDDPSVEDEIIKDQILHDVRGLLQYLPEEQREVVQMRHYAGMSFKDIAEQSDVSINTALGRMRYALINLRKLIEDKGIQLTVI
ncbi:MAG: RNA polymerase sigma factor (sigma-70 family) [Flavobacteriales bacterium]|jgi:RNA polymerase sigma factor (sigma-70 family)